jgi:hypothetical protein
MKGRKDFDSGNVIRYILLPHPLPGFWIANKLLSLDLANPSVAFSLIR